MQNTAHVNIDLTLTLHFIQICTIELLLLYHLISLQRTAVQIFLEGKYKQTANESTWFETDHFYHAAKQLCSMISGCCQHFCRKIIMLSSHNRVTRWRGQIERHKLETQQQIQLQIESISNDVYCVLITTTKKRAHRQMYVYKGQELISVLL